NANAIVVKEQETLSALFAGMLGFPTITITATSTTSMRGGVPHPLDVIVVLDTTGSMGGSCSASVPGKSSPTRLDCATAGVRALLGALWPCAQGLSTCGTIVNRNVPNPIDTVGLVVFPGLASSSYIPYEYDCLSSPSVQILPYSNTSALYAIIGLSSDYRTSDASGLNGRTSNLVQTVDWADGRTD